MKSIFCLFAAFLASASAQSIPDAIGTAAVTTVDITGKPWAYIRWSANDAKLLKNQCWAVYGRPGASAAPGTFAKQGTAMASPDPAVIKTRLGQAAALGDDLGRLGAVFTELLAPARWNGPQGAPLEQQISAAMNRAAGEEDSAQVLRTMTLGYPAMALAQGEAWAQRLPVPIGQPYTFEIRQAHATNPALDGPVLSRVEVIAGQGEPLPAPGLPQQICDVSPRGHLAVKLWWPISPALRKVSLSTYGFNLYRAAPGAFPTATPATTAQLRAGVASGAVKKLNETPVLTKEAANIPVGPTDETAPYYFADENKGAAPHAEGDTFQYYVVARDLLGNEGLASPAGMGVAISTLPPDTVRNVEVEEITTSVGASNVPVRQLRVSWSQNADNASIRTDAYRLYHGVAPDGTAAPQEVLDRWSAAPAAFAQCLFQEVPHTAGLDPKVKRMVVDVTLPRVATLMDKTLWFSVQAVHNGPAGCQVPGAPSPPSYGLFRSTEGPDAPKGGISFSCPRIALWSLKADVVENVSGRVNVDASNHMYQARWKRRDQEVAWVEAVLATETVTPGAPQIEGRYAITDFGRAHYGDGVNDMEQEFKVRYADVDAGHYLISRSGSTSGAISPWFVRQLPSPHGAEDILILRHQTESLTSGQVDPNSWQGDSLLKRDGNFVALLPAPNGVVSAAKAVSGALFTGGTFPPATAGMWEGVLVHMEPFRIVGAVSLTRMDNIGAVNLGDWSFSSLDPQAADTDAGNYRVALFKEAPQVCGHAARPENTDKLYPIDVTLTWLPGQNVSEYRLFRSFNDDTPSLIKQDARDFTAANITGIVTQDTAMPKTAGMLRYYAQTADQHGNASPLRLIATVPLIIKPAKPVLDKPVTRRDGNGDPEVALRWVCAPDGVQRFRVHVVPVSTSQGSAQPAKAAPSAAPNALPAQGGKLFTSLGKDNASIFTASETFGSSAIYQKLFESFYTPSPGQQQFSAGPSYTAEVRINGQGKYRVWVEAIDANGTPAAKSDERTFEWKEPTAPAPGYQIPWPARPLVKAAPQSARSTSRYNAVAQALFPMLLGGVAAINNANLKMQWPSPNEVGNEPCLGVLIGSWKKDHIANSTGAPGWNGLLDLNQRLIVPIGPQKAGLMLYRQQVPNNTFPSVSGATIQCTDRLDSVMSKVFQLPRATTVLLDLRLALTQTPESQGPVETQIYLLDQQPQISKASYRYTLVEFRPDGEIANIYPAGIVTLP